MVHELCLLCTLALIVERLFAAHLINTNLAEVVGGGVFFFGWVIKYKVKN